LAGKTLEVQIEFCGPCGYAPWAIKAAEELVTHCGKQLAAVTLIPSSGGTFEVRAGSEVIFSLDQTGRFPEAGEIVRILQNKQLIAEA
jgi:selT/selW/selH selenoprotein domain